MHADPEDVEALKREKPDWTEADVARLSAGEPLAYVIGTAPFLGLALRLDSRPLIPRPETEWWAEALIEELAGRESLRILDLCAGSGAIGLALAKHLPSARVSFGEISPEHTDQIRTNASRNGIDASRIDVRAGDLLAPFSGEAFDVIAANPPYIPSGRELPASVASYEPADALYAGEDGLGIIRRIARDAAGHLRPDGRLYMECDIANIGEARRLVLLGGMQAAEIRTDQYGRPRIVVALK